MLDLLHLAAGALIVLGGAGVLAAIGMFAVRSLRAQSADATRQQFAELARLNVETAARIETMRDMLAGRQAELARSLNERLDSVTHHLGQSMTTTRQQTVDSLSKLNERLAVIDGAQKNIAELASQVTSQRTILGNKQQRGAIGQARMEMIVQERLPKGC